MQEMEHQTSLAFLNNYITFKKCYVSPQLTDVGFPPTLLLFRGLWGVWMSVQTAGPGRYMHILLFLFKRTVLLILISALVQKHFPIVSKC